MQFQVPQFIEIEDKIFGPLTLKQFIYLAGGAGIVIVLFSFLPWYIAFLLAIPFGLFSVAMAFYKVNNKPFIAMVEAVFKYYTADRLYLWKREDKKAVASEQKNNSVEKSQIQVPRLSESKLKDLTWSLDINENSNPVTQSLSETGFREKSDRLIMENREENNAGGFGGSLPKQNAQSLRESYKAHDNESRVSIKK